jgi:hypothetical protein
MVTNKKKKPSSANVELILSLPGNADLKLMQFSFSDLITDPVKFE